MLNILEIYISNHHRNRMEVQSHAWVDCKDDNTTEIVNSEYVTTFDVETDGEKLGGGRGDASPTFQRGGTV